MVPYLVKIGVIPKSDQGSYEISECSLILNRLARYIDIEKPYHKICMYYWILSLFYKVIIRFEVIYLINFFVNEFSRSLTSIYIWCRLER
jgi:hypothetical protein